MKHLSLKSNSKFLSAEDFCHQKANQNTEGNYSAHPKFSYRDNMIKIDFCGKVKIQKISIKKVAILTTANF